MSWAYYVIEYSLLECFYFEVESKVFHFPYEASREQFDQPHTSTDYRKGFGSFT